MATILQSLWIVVFSPRWTTALGRDSCFASAWLAEGDVSLSSSESSRKAHP